jgi:hypothetical protein
MSGDSDEKARYSGRESGRVCRRRAPDTLARLEMAKKSKRPPARKQQRPQARPQTSRSALPLAGLSTSTAPTDAPAIDQDDYAATAIPYTESDGPMPLPPHDERDDVDAERAAAAVPLSRAQAAASTAPVSDRRRIGRVDPGAAAARQAQRVKSGRQLSTAAMFEPLPPDDAAIPFDRVPYVPGDLRRVLVIAALMVVLVVIADVVISNVVK